METNLNKLDKYSVIILKKKWTIESGLHSGDVLEVWGRLELGLLWALRRFFLTEVPAQVLCFMLQGLIAGSCCWQPLLTAL